MLILTLIDFIFKDNFCLLIQTSLKYFSTDTIENKHVYSAI